MTKPSAPVPSMMDMDRTKGIEQKETVRVEGRDGLSVEIGKRAVSTFFPYNDVWMNNHREPQRTRAFASHMLVIFTHNGIKNTVICTCGVGLPRSVSIFRSHSKSLLWCSLGFMNKPVINSVQATRIKRAVYLSEATSLWRIDCPSSNSSK